MLHVAMATFNEEEKKKFEEAVSVLVSFSERAHGVQESVSEPGCLAIVIIIIIYNVAIHITQLPCQCFYYFYY